MVVLFYPVVAAQYFGVGATLGFVFTHLTLQPFGEAGERKRPRSTTLGLSALGALAGGVLNFVVVWLGAA